MQKLLFISMLALSMIARAQEGEVLIDEKPLPAEKPASETVSEDDLFEKPKFKEVTPKADLPAVAPAPRASRAPAATVVPQRFVDKEMNVACYYLAPTDTNGVMSMYAAINCVKLEDPQEKLEREQERRERQSDAAKNEAAARAKQERETYEENQKTLQELRSRKSK